MPVVEETFDQNRIDGLRRSLQREADKGKPREFEIIVDNFKVVPRTRDINEFDDYEQELTDATQNVSFLVYNGGGNNRNTKYSFSFNRKRQNGQSATLGEIDQIIAQKLTERDKDYEMARLREKLEETTANLEEAEEYHEKLQARIVELEQVQKGRMINFGDLGASVLLGVLRKSPKDSFVGQALAGFLGPEDINMKLEDNTVRTTEGQASYSKDEQMDSQTRGRLDLLEQLQQKLDEHQMISVINILGHFFEHPEKINTVLELL